MTEPAASDPVSGAMPNASPVSRWRRLGGFVGPVISVGILVCALLEVNKHDWHKLIGVIQASPLIWLVLAVNYLSGPVGDWVIFRKLWKIPVEGIFPLIKKMIGNNLLLSYVGEVYFYDWARRHVHIAGSPFGAVKDVAILSALAGYAMTLLMLVLALPYATSFGFGISGTELYGSIGVMLVSGLVITVLRNRLLSLPRADLVFVFGVHMVRLLVNTVLTAVLWSLMLPNIPLSSWLILSTGRLLITRLPLLSNPEITFVGALQLLGGNNAATSDMITVIALFITAIHIVLFIAILLLDLVQKERNA